MPHWVIDHTVWQGITKCVILWIQDGGINQSGDGITQRELIHRLCHSKRLIISLSEVRAGGNYPGISLLKNTSRFI